MSGTYLGDAAHAVTTVFGVVEMRDSALEVIVGLEFHGSAMFVRIAVAALGEDRHTPCHRRRGRHPSRRRFRSICGRNP